MSSKICKFPNEEEFGLFFLFFLSKEMTLLLYYSDIHWNGNVQVLLLWLESVSYSTFWDTGV